MPRVTYKQAGVNIDAADRFIGLIKPLVKSTVSVIISISATTRTVVYAATGLVFKAALLIGGALAIPFAWTGLWLGLRIHVGLTQVQMRRAVGFVLVASGLVLLARALLG